MKLNLKTKNKEHSLSALIHLVIYVRDSTLENFNVSLSFLWQVIAENLHADFWDCSLSIFFSQGAP